MTRERDRYRESDTDTKIVIETESERERYIQRETNRQKERDIMLSREIRDVN